MEHLHLLGDRRGQASRLLLVLISSRVKSVAHLTEKLALHAFLIQGVLLLELFGQLFVGD